MSCDTYDTLRRWSATGLDTFCKSMWDYFDMQSTTAHSAALVCNAMLCAQYFLGTQVNHVKLGRLHNDIGYNYHPQQLKRALSLVQIDRKNAAAAYQG